MFDDLRIALGKIFSFWICKLFAEKGTTHGRLFQVIFANILEMILSDYSIVLLIGKRIDEIIFFLSLFKMISVYIS